MSRVFFIDDASGERRIDEADFPLVVGGSGTDVVLPGLPAEEVMAYIALEQGHAYIQPIDNSVELFHNHERVATSNWLKSGDQVQLGDWFLYWLVKGDQVFVKLRERGAEPPLVPPTIEPPATDELPEPEPQPPVAAAAAPGKAVKRSRNLRYLVFTLFGLLSLTALFVLFASPLSITVRPEPDSLSLSGFPPPVSLGRRLLVVPGSYTLNAGREGYYPLEETIEVTTGGLQTFDYQLRELPGKVIFILEPAVSFKAIVDDMEVAVDAANTVLIERGLRRIRIETERWLPDVQELEITGLGASQELAISLQPAWADVQLDSRPRGAQVKLDDEVLGTTPLSAEILQGERTLELSLAGYKTMQLALTVRAGTDMAPAVVALQANDGRLVLDSQPSGATVSIDGNFRGSTPASFVLTSGEEHLVRLSKPGYRKTERVITLAADGEQQLKLQLTAEYGTVFVSSRPADAGLALDGKPMGSATQRLRLSVRRHVLTFSKPGYETQNVTITPISGTSQNVDVVLKTREQVKAEATPAVLKTAIGQEMRLLKPTGSFQMGASRREAGRRANEGQRLVELTRPFYLSTREVTNAEFRRFRAKHNSGSAEGVSLNGDNYPVVNVSWDDAARYLNWLSQQDKLPLAYREQDGQMLPKPQPNTGYRLPTEAEWVFAARLAGRQGAARYPWSGSYPPVSVAGNFADAGIADTLANVVPDYNDGYRGPAPVGSFPVSPSGFYDLGGNVAEWVSDFYAVYPGQANQLVKDPTGAVSGEHHVVRDSSWRDGSITELRLSYRDYSRTARDNLGFRIARYVDE